jgi:hypothetical protein
MVVPLARNVYVALGVVVDTTAMVVVVGQLIVLS